MSRYSRDGTPPGEEDRFATITQKVLNALKEGPTTNKFLQTKAMDYSRRIYELQKQGYFIRSERLSDEGVWLYTLLDKPDPEYEVDIKVTFPDGYVHVYTVVVNANNVGKAKNIAQHGSVKTKILAVRRRPPDPTPDTPDPKAPAPAPLSEHGFPLHARKNGQGSGEEAP